jgi:transcriptional regulator of acetoin/glycerol metabolism
VDDLPEDFLDEQAHGAPQQSSHHGQALASSAVSSSAVVSEQSRAESYGPTDDQVARDDASSLQDVALAAMANMLRLHKGNVSAAAKALGVSRNTVYRRKDQLPSDVWG